MKVSVVQAVLALLLIGSCSTDSLAVRSFDVTRHFSLSANSTCGGDPPTLFEDQSAPGVLLNCTSGEYEARLALDGYPNTRWQSATGHTPVALTFSLQQVRAYQEGGGADCGWAVWLENTVSLQWFVWLVRLDSNSYCASGISTVIPLAS